MLFFAYFSVSPKRNIKRSPNGMKPSGALFLEKYVIQETWSGCQESIKEATRQGARPPPSWPLVAPPTYFFLLYISMYPANIQEHHETLFPPLQPSVPKRSHLGAFFGAPPEGALIIEGLYINSMAPPMMCE